MTKHNFKYSCFYFLAVFFLKSSGWASLGFFPLEDGTQLRVGSWTSQILPASDTIILLTGRGSFIEKNLPFIETLTEKGFNVETFDWRGHGGSTRVLPHPQKCHINSFDTYLQDLEEYLTNFISPKHKGPWLLLGISMGAHLALRYIAYNPRYFKKVSLIAPMFDIVTHPFPRVLVFPLIRIMNYLGFNSNYAFLQKDIDLEGPVPLVAFSKETRDAEQHESTYAIMKENPAFVVGGVTFGWMKAALQSMEVTCDPFYFSKIDVPIQVHLAGNDRIVNNKITRDLCENLPNYTLIEYPESFHALTREILEIRNLLLKNIIEFLKV